MKPKLEIFSDNKLKIFFLNLEEYFELILKGLKDLTYFSYQGRTRLWS